MVKFRVWFKLGLHVNSFFFYIRKSFCCISSIKFEVKLYLFSKSDRDACFFLFYYNFVGIFFYVIFMLFFLSLIVNDVFPPAACHSYLCIYIEKLDPELSCSQRVFTLFNHLNWIVYEFICLLNVCLVTIGVLGCIGKLFR